MAKRNAGTTETQAEKDKDTFSNNSELEKTFQQKPVLEKLETT